MVTAPSSWAPAECRPRHTSPRVPAGGARLVGGGGGGADARHVVTCPWKAAPGAARVAPAAAGLPQKGERLAAAVGASARGRFVWATRATARVTAGMHQRQPRRRPSPCPCPCATCLDPSVPCAGHASVRAVTCWGGVARSDEPAGRFRFAQYQQSCPLSPAARLTSASPL